MDVPTVEDVPVVPNRAKLLTFFRLEGETLPEFAQMLRRMDEDEKNELALEVQAYQSSLLQ